MAVNPHSVFGFLLKEANYAEQDIAKITQVGAQVSSFVAALPPVNPASLFGQVLKLVGIAENEIPKIQAIGAKARVYVDIIQQVEGADAEFQAGQPVTGAITIYHKYNYSFQPA